MYEKILVNAYVPPMGTALPSSPSDGDQFLLVDSMSAPTYSWLLRYVAAKASNKWVFIGGAPLQTEVATSETQSVSAGYNALATAGPAITLPVAGDYLIGIGYQADTYPGVVVTGFMSYDIGATGAVDADSVQATQAPSGSALSAPVRFKKKTGLTAVTLTSKYKSGSALKFAQRWISAEPIALGG